MFTNDTNILIYSFDEGVPAKHAIAKRIMQRHAQLMYPVPLQSLAEFYRSTTSKWLLTHRQATDFVTRIVSTFHVEAATTDDVLAAMWLHDRHRTQFFDALLLMTAKRAGCTLLFSEDLQDKRDYDGITVRNPFVRFVFHFGLAGLPIISAIDSSFVPLPIPGVTDILIIIYAANKSNLILLVGLATVGSAAGGWFSHWVGHKGGTAFLEKHVSKRILSRVTEWMEKHAILAVALPALLPPPMPLSPFVLVAGASNMSQKKFLTAFTVSRFVRHAIAAWIGVVYGRHFIHWWNTVSKKWGTPVLVGLWVFMIVFAGIAIWKLWQTSREMKGRGAAAVA